MTHPPAHPHDRAGRRHLSSTASAGWRVAPASSCRSNGATSGRPQCPPGMAAASEKMPEQTALQLTTDDHLATSVNAVNLKDRLAMSKPIVVIVCMARSSEWWEPNSTPLPWHRCAGGGAVHSINNGSRTYSINSPATGRAWLLWSFGQPGLPQSFFVSREVLGTAIRAQHVLESGNTQRGIQLPQPSHCLMCFVQPSGHCVACGGDA